MDPFNEVVACRFTSGSELLRQNLVVQTPNLSHYCAEGWRLQLRMIDTTHPRSYEQIWPGAMEIFINGCLRISIKAAVGGQRRRDEPEDVTEAFRHGRNVIRCLVEDSMPGRLALGLVWVRPKSVDALGRKICSQGAGATWCLDQPPASSDVECVTRMQLNLCCPLTLVRIQDCPVRGRYCKHWDCFELSAFLSVNHKLPFNQRWRCPVCSLSCRPEDLAVDAAALQLLRATAKSKMTQIGLDAAKTVLQRPRRSEKRSLATVSERARFSKLRRVKHLVLDLDDV